MGSTLQNQYEPDVVPPPGETLSETLDMIGMSQRDLSERSGRTPKTINEIIRGKAPITPETALQFEKILGIPSSFWNNREKTYREYLARKQEEETLKDSIAWLRQIPIKEMINLGWIPYCKDKLAQFKAVLSFFGVASSEQWEIIWNRRVAIFRKSNAFVSNLGSVAAWLRMGELEAQKIQCEPYDEKKFKRALIEIKKLTTEPPDRFVPKLTSLCALVGVAVVFIPELPKTHTFGSTRWLTPKKALIQLSLRYKSNDHLWFTFFHEAGHILRHGKKDVFLERSNISNEQESEADKFAANFLIPSGMYNEFVNNYRITKRTITQFAQVIDIDPGIVIGRLQHDKIIPFNRYNSLKRRYTWA